MPRLQDDVLLQVDVEEHDAVAHQAVASPARLDAGDHRTLAAACARLTSPSVSTPTDAKRGGAPNRRTAFGPTIARRRVRARRGGAGQSRFQTETHTLTRARAGTRRPEIALHKKKAIRVRFMPFWLEPPTTARVRGARRTLPRRAARPPWHSRRYTSRWCSPRGSCGRTAASRCDPRGSPPLLVFRPRGFNPSPVRRLNSPRTPRFPAPVLNPPPP